MSLLLRNHALLSKYQRRPVNGYLYNQYAVLLTGFAPTGWRVPTEADFLALQAFLNPNAGTKMKAGYAYWDALAVEGTNESGFTGFGSGFRNPDSDALFLNYKKILYLWSQTTGGFPFTSASYGQLSYSTTNFSIASNLLRKTGGSVRLIKTDSTDPGFLIDQEGNYYDTVKIGTQVWIKQNWASRKLNSGASIPNKTAASDWFNDTAGAYCAFNNNESYV